MTSRDAEMTTSPRIQTMNHWGASEVETRHGRIVTVHPFRLDPDPAPIAQSLLDGISHPIRIRKPAARKGWLENGPGPAPRGAEPFVELEWDAALDLAAKEIARVREAHGNGSIFAGSYGWASAGRFHHAQSQLRRFLNLVGGHVQSVDTYSHAAAEVVVPHILGMRYDEMQAGMTSWPVILEHTRLFVAFGGVPLKNTQIESGGQGRHLYRGFLEEAARRGMAFIQVSPIRDDLPEELGAAWIPARPGTDTAMMLALAHTLIVEGLVDLDFVRSHTAGYETFRAYVTGEADGKAKDAEWAGEITEIEAEGIRRLARAMARHRTMINVSWSIQRADHGEQPLWAAVALAALLGQIGLPGGGIGIGYGSVGSVGNGVPRMPIPRLTRAANPVTDQIPVARITDALLDPGGTYRYNGKTRTYPDIRLVYWAGGNPFHHQQDLNRLVTAWQRPETVIVHEPVWNAHARHADLVFPATLPVERNDLGGSSVDNVLMAMPKIVEPPGEARSDHAIFAGLAERLGVAEAFTEGRDEMAWLRHLYGRFQAQSNALPDFDTFWGDGWIEFPEQADRPALKVFLDRFRADPEAHPLRTPSGRIELASPTIAGFGDADCPGHPAWLEPYEWLGAPEARRYPLHLISNQPKTRLHSQLDHGRTSLRSKIRRREPIRINTLDAAVRSIKNGQVVTVHNARGSCLAGAVVTDAVRPGVVELATGAWFDPETPGTPGGMCRHGNPNVLTRDKGTSSLAQGSTAHSCLVEVARYDGPVPQVGSFAPPRIERPPVPKRETETPEEG